MHKVCLNYGEMEVWNAWGEFLEGLADWKLFVTLTMRDRENRAGERYSPGITSARRMSTEFFVQCRLWSSDVDWVCVYELQRGRDVYHSHALVGGPFEKGVRESLTGLRAWSWEKWGFNRVVEYLPARGAAGYLGKYLVKEGGDVEFSPGLAGGKR